MIFKNNEINESYKLCQISGKHTVGGIVFYKHLFLVMWVSSPDITRNASSVCRDHKVYITVQSGLLRIQLNACSYRSDNMVPVNTCNFRF